jgi:FG-GAP-like repeat
MQIQLRICGYGLVLAMVVLPGLAQESAQLIAAPEVIAGSQDAFRIAPDLNGDGDKDAVSVWFPSGTMARVAGFWNDGTGVLTEGWVANFTITPSTVLNPTPIRLAAGDLDGDGAEDFVFTIDGWVGWWIAHGDLVAPDVPWGVLMPSTVLGIAIADFNGDGRGDVALTLAGEVRIYLTQASGPPVLSSTYPLPGADGRGVIAARVDGDLIPDLAVVRGTSVDLLPVVAGAIQPGTTFPLFSSASSSVLSGDVDNDGDEDVVVTLSANLTIGVLVLRRTGPASFGPDPWQAFPSHVAFGSGLPRALVDADADGDLDLLGLAGVQGFYSIGVSGSNGGGQACYLRRNDGTGVFGPDSWWLVAGGTVDFACPDLDGDGDADFVGGLCVDFATPGRGFAHDPAPRTVNGLAPMGDVDGDGDPDVGPGIAGLSVQGFLAPGTATNDGNGLFSTVNSMAPAPAPGASFAGPGFAGDFDGDGDLDLVVEHYIGSTPSGAFEMRLLQNLGGGSFADGGPATAMGATMRTVPTNSAAGFATIDTIDARSVLVADLDGDGDVDLVPYFPTTGSQGANVQGSALWLNGGTGFFTQAGGLSGTRPTAAGDVNGDAIPDLLAISFVTGYSSVVILPGLGGGGFGTPIIITSFVPDPYYACPALGDVDGDGDRDVVMTTPGALSVFVNDGIGGFTQTAAGSFNSSGFSVCRIADMNVDGLADLLVSASGPTPLRIFLHDPSGPGWLPSRLWSTSIGAISDVDGDGDLDLLEGGAAIVPSVLHRNATFAPPGNGRRQQYGAGLGGSAGLVPILGSAGVLRPGFSGSLRITNALGGAPALLGAGLAQASQPAVGGTLLIVPSDLVPLTLGGAPGVAGAGSSAVPWTIPPALAGFQGFLQAAIQDPAAPQGFALTNGLDLVIGL